MNPIPAEITFVKIGTSFGGTLLQAFLSRALLFPNLLSASTENIIVVRFFLSSHGDEMATAGRALGQRTASSRG